MSRRPGKRHLAAVLAIGVGGVLGVGQDPAVAGAPCQGPDTVVATNDNDDIVVYDDRVEITTDRKLTTVPYTSGQVDIDARDGRDDIDLSNTTNPVLICTDDDPDELIGGTGYVRLWALDDVEVIKHAGSADINVDGDADITTSEPADAGVMIVVSGDAQIATGAGVSWILVVGDAEIDTGPGDDTVRGGDGDQQIDLGPGNDWALTGDGEDHVDGGPGYDYCDVWPSTDPFVGGPNDTYESCEGPNLPTSVLPPPGLNPPTFPGTPG